MAGIKNRNPSYRSGFFYRRCARSVPKTLPSKPNILIGFIFFSEVSPVHHGGHGDLAVYHIGQRWIGATRKLNHRRTVNSPSRQMTGESFRTSRDIPRRMRVWAAPYGHRPDTGGASMFTRQTLQHCVTSQNPGISPRLPALHRSRSLTTSGTINVPHFVRSCLNPIPGADHKFLRCSARLRSRSSTACLGLARSGGHALPGSIPTYEEESQPFVSASPTASVAPIHHR